MFKTSLCFRRWWNRAVAVGLPFILAMPGQAQTAKAVPPPIPLRPTSALDVTASNIGLSVRSKTDQAGPVKTTRWVADLLEKDQTWFSLMSTRTVSAREPGTQWEDSFRTDVLLTDKDGSARTLVSIRQAQVRPEDPMVLNSSWGSWLAFGRPLELSGSYSSDPKLRWDSYRLDSSNRAILGIGVQDRNPDRNSYLGLQSPFLPYGGFDLDHGTFGIFCALGLVDHGTIVETRKIARAQGAWVIDVATSNRVDFDLGREEIKNMGKDQGSQPTPSSIVPGSDGLRLQDFTAIHGIEGGEWLRGSTFFRRPPSHPQDRFLDLPLQENLAYQDTVLAGRHENGRTFILGILKIPTLNVWCLLAKYDDEPYPRLAFCLLNLIGLTRDGKSVSWIAIPKPSPSLYHLEHDKVNWKKPVLDSDLENASAAVLTEGDGGKADTYILAPAINGIR